MTTDPRFSDAPRAGVVTSVRLLDPALAFMQVLWQLEHGLERTSKRMEDTLGVTGPQRFALRVIGAIPDIGLAELAAVLHLHRSTVTGVIQRLESRGLVRRIKHASDGRRSHLRVTRAGAKLSVPKAPGSVEEAVRATLESFSDEHRTVATTLLERLSSELLNRCEPSR